MPGKNTPASFAARVLKWHAVHGRHDFPWQHARTPYRVWVAEIMLQQTQAATVIPYFERFLVRFPDLQSLAAAELDDVLALWSGLGYYARGRNLHATARICAQEFNGRLPYDAKKLESLPGIGRSTANAIVAQAFDQRAPILDGNVKRVLARHAGIEGWPGRQVVLKRLWLEADRRTPPACAADYTQAIMDLGATICSPRKPKCADCPVAADCVAKDTDRIGALPGRKPPRRRPTRTCLLLLVEDEAGRLLLQRRPPAGIWGGLWCLPEHVELPQQAQTTTIEGVIEHDFTHFRLLISLARTQLPARAVKESGDQAWMDQTTALTLGLPQPIRKIIEQQKALTTECPTP